MNAIHKNEYTASLIKLSATLPEPEAILVVTAHWLTQGTRITSGRNPEQIYDFYGFPEELYTVKYQPPGSPDIAAMIKRSVSGVEISEDEDRGIDHAAWAVLKHIYPGENVPVLELSLDMNVSPDIHYGIGKSLTVLRERGILIIGSGNIVHNLQVMEYYEGAEPQSRAVEFDEMVKKNLLEDNHSELIEYEKWGKISKYAVPTDEHYIPMIYTAALKQEGESLEFIHESILHGSISMRSFIIR
jgi:4,5-DOPA dioxygenase extradiol